MINHISFKEAYINFWRNSIDFSGRASRKEYWFPMIVNVVIVLLVIALANQIDVLLGIDPDKNLSTSNIVDKTLGFIFSFAILSVTVRRFHDINLPGIFAIIPGCLAMIMVIGALVLSHIGVNTEGFMAKVVPVVLFIIVIVFILTLLKDGTKGPNKYGEDPLNR